MLDKKEKRRELSIKGTYRKCTERSDFQFINKGLRYYDISDGQNLHLDNILSSTTSTDSKQRFKSQILSNSSKLQISRNRSNYRSQEIVQHFKYIGIVQCTDIKE